MMRRMDLAHLSGSMASNILDSGKKISKKVMEQKFGPMEPYSKEFIVTARKMAWEFSNGSMDPITSVNSKTITYQVRARTPG